MALEKLLGGFHVAFLAKARINKVAISVNGAIEIAPLSVNFDICLIHLPGSSGLSPPFYPQLVCYQGRKPCFPVPHGFMGEHHAPLPKHFREIPQAQFVAKPPQDNQQNHISGIFEEVERRSCTLVEAALTS